MATHFLDQTHVLFCLLHQQAGSLPLAPHVVRTPPASISSPSLQGRLHKGLPPPTGTLRKPTSQAAAAASPGSPQKHSFSGSTAVLREPKLRGRAQHTVSTSLQVLLMYNPCGPHYLTLTTLPGREGTIISPISQMRKTKVREVTKRTVATQVASGVTFSSYQRKEGVMAW